MKSTFHITTTAPYRAYIQQSGRQGADLLSSARVFSLDQAKAECRRVLESKWRGIDLTLEFIEVAG